MRPLTGFSKSPWTLFLGIALWGAAAQDVRTETRWPDEQAAGVFHCHADFGLERFEQLWSQMAALQQDLRRALRVPTAGEPIHLFLFEQKGTYQDYIDLHFPGVPYRRALYIKEQGPGMVFAFLNNDFETDVRHESTHALLHASLPVVPLWLDEGLAEYFEVPSAERPHHPAHLGKVIWAARFGRAPNLVGLEKIGDLSKMGATQYRHAWAWVHFMLHGPAEAHEELVSFLAAIQSQTPPGILSERLRKRIPDLEERFVEHFRNWK